MRQARADREAAACSRSRAPPSVARSKSVISGCFNHPLVDGNKRLAWLATWVFLARNDVELDPDDDAAYDLVVGIAAGEIDDVGEIAAALSSMIAAKTCGTR